MLALSGLSAWGLWRASEASEWSYFLLYVLPTLFSIVLLPLLAYRLYALRSARYVIDRDGFRLVWGIRAEDIPMQAVVLVQFASELGGRLPLPWLRWPGAVLGIRRLRDGRRVEFLAARSHPLVVIVLADKLFAISPDDPHTFLGACRGYMEMGSLTPIPSRTVYPGFLLARLWQTPAARYLVLAGLLLNLIALGRAALASITLGFGPGREPVPAVQLLLLPVLGSFFFLVDFVLGLFLFRRSDVQTTNNPWFGTLWMIPGRTMAYLVWLGGVLVSSLLLTAIILILKAG